MKNSGGEERCIKVLMEKSDCRRTLGRAVSRWEDNIKLDVP